MGDPNCTQLRTSQTPPLASAPVAAARFRRAAIAVARLAPPPLVAVYDVTQRRHAVLRTFPVIGHLRFILEAFGPELRQYIVTSNDDERPFSRNERRWIYASSKQQNKHQQHAASSEQQASSSKSKQQ